MAQLKQATMEETLRDGLHLSITDPEMVAEFKRVPVPQLQDYALRALKVGVLAIRSARGEVDAQAVKDQLSAALNELHLKLLDHARTFNQQLESAKTFYKENGEVGRSMLEQQLNAYKTQLLATIDTRILAAADPLLKALDPKRTDGAVGAMDVKVKDALNAMANRIKEEVLSQFSRDSSGSAISRIEDIIQRSHQAITTQFSMDDPNSAIRRLYNSVGEQMEVLTRGNMEFQAEVREALAALSAKKESAAVSPEHGRDFEQDLGAALIPLVQRHGHTVEATGNSVGTIRSCKVGDWVITLNQDSMAPGEKIVVEAKSAGGYDLARILAESEVGRKNRGAQVSIFVMDPPYAPASMTLPFARHGDALIVKWQRTDTEAFLAAAVATACALIVKASKQGKRSDVDAAGMEREVVEIQRRVVQMADVSQFATTIQTSAAKILDRMRIALDAITSQAEMLMDQIKSLKGVTADGNNGEN